MSRFLSAFLASALLAVFCLAPTPAAAQAKKAPPAGGLKVRWLGQSMFEIITPKGAVVLTDPHNIEGYRIKDVRPKIKPDLILMSHFHTEHVDLTGLGDVKGVKQYNALKKDDKGRPSEWNEVDGKLKDVHYRSLPSTYHDDVGGTARGLNGVWVMDVDGVRIVHLGDLGHRLTKAQLKKLGPVDVLMIPVGGVYTLNGITAQQVVEQVKPRRCVLPMHYGTPVFDDLLILKYFTDEVKEAGTPIRYFRPKEWLTIDPKSPLPKAPTVGVLHYSWW
jgi:L-ascorbate metabolism protein UlaG (beta-lactamase superfamily)